MHPYIFLIDIDSLQPPAFAKALQTNFWTSLHQHSFNQRQPVTAFPRRQIVILPAMHGPRVKQQFRDEPSLIVLLLVSLTLCPFFFFLPLLLAYRWHPN